jgi:hypothetical protein
LTTNSDRRYFLLQNKTFASFGRQLVTEHTMVSKHMPLFCSKNA